MNRYTFKAKRKDNGKWVYGNVIINPNSTDKVVIVESGVTSYSSTKEAILEFINDYVEVIPETLCQCTGLQDIDGNYIFENDIVELNNNHYIVLYSENRQSFVYKQIKGSITYLSLDEIYEYAKEENDYVTLCIEVIGNKFDKEVE